MFFLCMCYTFSSTKSYDMHKGFHDWLMSSGEMVIYVFLKRFKSNSQRHVTSNQDKVIKTINIFPTQHALQSFNQKGAISKLIKAKQGTKDMLCENRLTNLVFKTKKNSAKHNLLSFSSFFFLIKKKKLKTTQNEMYECYAMQILETKRTKTKEQWSQRVQ